MPNVNGCSLSLGPSITRSLEQAEKILMPKDYLRYRLTGTWQRLMDLTALLFHVPKKKWRPASAGTDLSPDLLPEVLPALGSRGSHFRTSAAGRREGTPSVWEHGQACEAFGSGTIRPVRYSELATAECRRRVTERTYFRHGFMRYYHIVNDSGTPCRGHQLCGGLPAAAGHPFFGNGPAAYQKWTAAESIPPGSGRRSFPPEPSGSLESLSAATFWDHVSTARHFVRACWRGGFSLYDCLLGKSLGVRPRVPPDWRRQSPSDAGFWAMVCREMRVLWKAMPLLGRLCWPESASAFLRAWKKRQPGC